MNLKLSLKRFLRSLLFKLIPELRSLENRTVELRFDLNRLLDHYDTHSPDFLKKRDAELVKKEFRKKLNCELNLENPETFNEKIQWLKIHHRKKGLHVLSDKYTARDYLAKRGYNKYLNILFGVYSSSKELINDWGNLPDSFVLKASHWSGGNFFVNDKNSFDKKDLKKMDEWLQMNYYHYRRWGNWINKDMKPFILAEKYLKDDDNTEVQEYHLFCFGGKVKYIFVNVDTDGIPKRAFYDSDWKKQNFSIKKPMYSGEIAQPVIFDEMKDFAESVSKDQPFLRVDLYTVNSDQIVFGELTFFHQSGFGKFIPQEWDRKLGDLIELPLNTPEVFP